MGLLDFLFKKPKKGKNINKSVQLGNKPRHTEPFKPVQQSSPEINPFYKTKLECDFTPGELILIDWTDKTNRNHNFPGYFQYTFGIDAKKVQKKLLRKGYFIQSKTLKPLKVVDLKSILIDHQLSTVGKKAELISRIEENIDLSTLDLPVSYILTDKSRQLLNQNNGYVKAYHDPYFDMENYHIYRDKIPFNKIYGDVKWSYLNDESSKHTIARHYGLLRNNRLAQFQQLHDEGKTLSAFPLIVEVFLFDISGLGNSYKNTGKPFYEYVTVAPTILKQVQELGLQLNKEDYNRGFERACRDISFLNANHFLTTADYAYLKNNILTATVEEIEEYLKKYSEFKLN